MKTPSDRDWQPIESYAAIGNLRTAAVAGLGGSIDWLCLPYLAHAEGRDTPIPGLIGTDDHRRAGGED